jgi:hypothetical protein
MISLSYADLFFLYVALFLILIAVLWSRENSRVKRHERRNFSSRLFFCEKCRKPFLQGEDVNLCRCPNCNTVCIRPRRRDLE